MSSMPSSLDVYLEFSGPKVIVFDDMIMQCASSELFVQTHSEATPPTCHINSSKHILTGKHNEKCAPQYRVRGIISQST